MVESGTVSINGFSISPFLPINLNLKRPFFYIYPFRKLLSRGYDLFYIYIFGRLEKAFCRCWEPRFRLVRKGMTIALC